MALDKRISPIGIQALKDALCTIYWYKSDLKSFLNGAISDPSIVVSLDWGQYKRQIVSNVIDIMVRNQGKYLNDLLYLCSEIVKLESFPHLEKLDDGTLKAKKAKEAVTSLKSIIQPHQNKQDELKKINERRKNAEQKLQESQAVREKLEEIKSNYFQLLSMTPQQRGYQLEKLMYELFNLFDLDPKASFKVTGEQIDGAFYLDGTDYLFEAKWKNERCSREDMDAFSSKISRKLENTLGLFLSINDFSTDAVNLYSSRGASFILMTGAELMAVLEGRVDFTSLLLMKKRHASQTGEVLMCLSKIY